jgi:hypothetical protein
MNLKEYLYIERIKQVDAARRLGITPSTFGNIVRGVACSEKMAKKISDWTKGKVAIESLRAGSVPRVRCCKCGSLVKKKLFV